MQITMNKTCPCTPHQRMGQRDHSHLHVSFTNIHHHQEDPQRPSVILAHLTEISIRKTLSCKRQAKERKGKICLFKIILAANFQKEDV